MPKRTDISSILVIGAGPIVIGQACEFDYSGVQAIKALREEGYRIVLVNSNPATIMTDPELADATYVEPITPEIVAKIIEKERPDAVLPTMGGQTALNTALGLKKKQRIATDGVYGKGTAAAVSKFEESAGLPIDGIADEQVVAALGLDHAGFTLARGAKHSSVASIQKALVNVLGVKMKADGVFGSGTDKQVKKFQKSVGLKATGVVDRTTWMALLTASAQR